MRMRRLVQAASITGVALFVMAASATAFPITFNTSAAGTGFGLNGIGGLTLNNTSGVAATLKFTPNPNDVQGGPTNISLGSFTLTCATCGAANVGLSSTFGAFTLEMILTDVTDVATGKFIGTSTGGTVFAGVSPIDVYWAPLQLGPAGNNALTGSFGPSIFRTTVYTGVVAPNNNGGVSTVQGSLVSSAIPEPATLGLVGAALLCLGMVSRKKFSN